MFRKLCTHGGILLLAGAVLIATPGSSRAQHHGGGGHFGGAHFGGAHFGGAHFGGYGGGFNRYGYHPYSHYGYHPYSHYGFYGLYGYPYYSGYYPFSYDYYPYYGTYADLGSGLTYNSGYYGLYAGGTPYPDGYAAPAASYQTYSLPGAGQSDLIANAATALGQPDAIAHVTVKVPNGARVWFDDTATESTGSTRQFDSPPLTPGQRYSYAIRARWNENGHEVTQTQQVDVSAGAHVNVNFPVPPKTTREVPATKPG
jgi:uncharacterized protein (TIGR03000 family)